MDENDKTAIEEKDEAEQGIKYEMQKYYEERAKTRELLKAVYAICIGGVINYIFLKRRIANNMIHSTILKVATYEYYYYEVTLPLLILSLGLIGFQFFRKKKWIYILVNVLLIAVNIWAFATKTVLFGGE